MRGVGPATKQQDTGEANQGRRGGFRQNGFKPVEVIAVITVGTDDCVTLDTADDRVPAGGRAHRRIGVVNGCKGAVAIHEAVLDQVPVVVRANDSPARYTRRARAKTRAGPGQRVVQGGVCLCCHVVSKPVSPGRIDVRTNDRISRDSIGKRSDSRERISQRRPCLCGRVVKKAVVSIGAYIRADDIGTRNTVCAGALQVWSGNRWIDQRRVGLSTDVIYKTRN